MQALIDIAKLILSLSLPLFSGWLICEVILYKRQAFGRLQKLALGYGVGLGVLSLVMLLLSLLKIKFSFLVIALSLFTVTIPFLAVYLRLHRIPVGPPKKNQYKQQPLFHKILTGIIILVILFVLFKSLIVPMHVWDSWAIYGFKAKAFFIEGGVSAGFLQDATKSYMHADYPLLVPLSETWVYICLGGWNDQLVKVIFWLYFLALIIIFHSSLSHYIGKKYSLLFTVLLVSVPDFVFLGSSGYADLPLIFYFFTSLIFLLRAYENCDRRGIIISGIFAGLAAWTKNEGLVIGLLNFLVLMAMFMLSRKINRRNIVSALQYLSIIFLIIAPWFWARHSLGLTNDVMNSANLNLTVLAHNLGRVSLILANIGRHIFLFKTWNLLWVFSAAIIIVNLRKMILFPYLFISLMLLFYLSVWILIYIISPYDINWHLGTSLNRLLLHIIPPVLFLDGLLVYRNLND